MQHDDDHALSAPTLVSTQTAQHIPPIPKPRGRKAKEKTEDQTDQKAQTGNGKGNPNHSRDRRRLSWVWKLTAEERKTAMDTWRGLGADAHALEVFSHRAPEVLEAILQGAATPGVGGAFDRAIFLRIIGLGHLTKQAPASLAQSDRDVRAIGDRLAARLASAAGRKSVPTGPVIDIEPLQDAALIGVTHKMPDLVREMAADPAPVEPIGDDEWS